MIIFVLLSFISMASMSAQTLDLPEYIKSIRLLQDSLKMRSVVQSIPVKARILFRIGNIYEENNLFSRP
jgi:hypothetical protein